METIKQIVDASYTFKDVAWYCWITALVVTMGCLAWHEMMKGDE